MVKRLLAPLALVATVLFVPLAALAQEAANAVASSLSLDDVAKVAAGIVDAARHGQWTTVGVLVLTVVTLVLRRYGAALMPALGGDLGGTILGNFGTPILLLGGLGLTGVPITRPMLEAALLSGAVSSTVYQTWRRAIVKGLAPLAAKLVGRIPVVGGLLAPFVEKPLGALLDLVRESLAKRAQKADPVIASQTSGLKAPPVAAPADIPEAEFVVEKTEVGEVPPG